MLRSEKKKYTKEIVTFLVSSEVTCKNHSRQTLLINFTSPKKIAYRYRLICFRHLPRQIVLVTFSSKNNYYDPAHLLENASKEIKENQNSHFLSHGWKGLLNNLWSSAFIKFSQNHTSTYYTYIHTYIYMNTHTHIYMHIYVYIYI